MLEGIQILIDRMEMFPDDFREGGALHDFVYILDGNNYLEAAEYYKQILTEEEISAYREATIKFHRENFNRKVIESVMEGQDKYNPHKFAEKLKRGSGLYGEVAVGGIYTVSSGGAGGGSGTIGGGAFTTKTGALFTPANTSSKEEKLEKLEKLMKARKEEKKK